MLFEIFHHNLSEHDGHIHIKDEEKIVVGSNKNIKIHHRFITMPASANTTNTGQTKRQPGISPHK